MNELWKPVPGWEGLYEVSDQGRVRSVQRTVIRYHLGTRVEQPVKARLLKLCLNSSGYICVNFWRKGKQHMQRVHRLVALAFLGEPPPGKPWVLHGRGGHRDNRVSNLSWGDPKQNAGADRLRDGTLPHSEQHSAAKLTPDQVRAIRADNRLHRVIAASYGICRQSITDIKRRKTWAHLP